MDPSVKSLLYDQPRLYDLVFPDADDTTGKMCRTGFERYLSAPPVSVLDVGCGTGRLLESLSEMIPECWGVDYLETNVAHARTARPGLVIRRGDMRAIGMYDNREFKASDLAGTVVVAPDVAGMRGRKLYTFALKA